VIAAFTSKTKKELAALIPAVAAMPDAKTAAAYLCVNRACGLPISKPSELIAKL
jgi:uncharacterized protein YyaL (SSP411 family)